MYNMYKSSLNMPKKRETFELELFAMNRKVP